MKKILLIVLILLTPFISYTAPEITTSRPFIDFCDRICDDCTDCNWPEYRHDNFNTAFTDDYCAPPCDNIEQIWAYTMAPLSPNDKITSPPSVDRNKVVFGTTGGQVICLNAYNQPATTPPIWVAVLTGQFVSSPNLYNRNVYIASTAGILYCLDLETGTILWQAVTLGSISSSPKILEDKVYVGSKSGKMYCFDAGTGAMLWSYDTKNSISASPTVGYKKVWFTTDNGFIYSLNMDNGKLIPGWPLSIAKTGYPSAIVYDNDYLYYTNGRLMAMNAWNGKQIINTIPSSNVVTCPAVQPKATLSYPDSRQYVGTSNRIVYKLFENARTRLWARTNTTTFDGLNSSPSISQNRVYFTTTNRLMILDAENGAVKNNIAIPIAPATPTNKLTSIAIAYQRLYFASNSGTIYSYGCCTITDPNADCQAGPFALILTPRSGVPAPVPVQRCCKLKFDAVLMDACPSVRPEFNDQITYTLDTPSYAFAQISMDGTLTVNCNAPVGTIILVTAHLFTTFEYKGEEVVIMVDSVPKAVIVVP